MLWEKNEIQFEHIWFDIQKIHHEIKLGKRKILFEHIDYLGSKRNNNGWRSFS